MTFDLSVGFRSVLTAVTGAVLLMSPSANAGEREANPAATLYNYQFAEGDSCVALAVRANILGTSSTAGRQHVVMIDTSASQVGEHRQQAFAVLESFLAALPDQDRVHLIAVDVTAKSMHEGFVTPQGGPIQTALTALKQRAPLGATNLLRGLHAALESLGNDNPGSVVYIGDGMSTAQLVQSKELKTTVAEFRSRRIPFHSYAVGPQTDLQLLGILGQQTGGLVLIDQIDKKHESPKLDGKKLAKAVNVPVFYASDITTNIPGLQLLPNNALPLRGGRETIYIGRGTLTGDVEVTVTGEWNGRNQKLNWTINKSDFRPGHALLANAWERMAADGGLTVAYAGTDLMHEAEVRFEREVAHLISLGERAVSTRNLKQAEKIGRLVESYDPANIHVKSLLGSVKKIRMQNAAQQTTNRNVAIQLAQNNPPAPGGAPEAKAPANVDERIDVDPDADLIEREIRRRAAFAEQLTQEVNRTVKLALRMSRDEPDAALSMLKKSLGTIASTTDLDLDVRARMERDLRATMQQINTDREIIELTKEKTLARRTQIEANQRLQDTMMIEEQKLDDLIAQVRGLIVEGIHGDDNAFENAESVAEVAVDLKPGSGASAVARFDAEAYTQLRRSFRLRALRADRFLDTLHQVELSHVPFPDEPPIRWPAASVWRALTERRRKWAAVDLRRERPSEEKIRSALDDETEMQFAATPLKEALEFLAEQHDFNLIFENGPIETDGIDIEGVEVNQILSGITLRSALRLILSEHDLTYVIEDEVMKITTVTEAESKMVTRIYPVGDLVVSFEPLQAAGGGGFGGQQGGGIGGQQGGGGGNFGGQGGGQFSIPAEDFTAQPVRKNNQRRPALRVGKKKP